LTRRNKCCKSTETFHDEMQPLSNLDRVTETCDSAPTFANNGGVPAAPV
jgi:hypothetical protein